MAYTEQQRALDRVKALFGRSGFTEDHRNYKRVGCRIGLRKIWADADTWENAIDQLVVKADYPDSHAFHFEGEFTIVDGIGPAMSSRSWLSGQFKTKLEAWANAAGRLLAGRVRA